MSHLTQPDGLGYSAMARFSNRTLRLLGEEFSGWWTLGTISELFDDAGVALGPEEVTVNVSGQRRSLAKQYLSTLDQDAPAELAKLVEVVNHVLFEIAHREYDDSTGVQWRDRFLDQIRRDGFVLDADIQIVAPTASSSRLACSLVSMIPRPSATTYAG